MSETSGNETAKKTAMPEKRAQPNGRGALLAGGMPGNAGGGRTPSAIRAAAREMAADRLKVLGQIARRTKAKDSDRIAAVKALADIGLSETINVSDVRRALDETGEIIRERMAPDEAESLIEAIRPIWLRL